MNTTNLANILPSKAYNYVLQIVDKYKITSPLRLAHFLAQTAHESGNFHFVEENLNYSADALLRVFPKYFQDRATAVKYARKPVMIGSRVYANRMGNGDEASMEGFKFFGRGYLQITGKNNYIAFSTFIGEDCVANPDLVATKYAMESAIWFFNKNKLWDICDKGATRQIIIALTKRINGGTNGLIDRLNKFNLYFRLLNKI